jgi:hypothetical protein
MLFSILFTDHFCTRIYTSRKTSLARATFLLLVLWCTSWRHWQQWAHKTQGRMDNHGDTDNNGHTRHKEEWTIMETLTTMGTLDTRKNGQQPRLLPVLNMNNIADVLSEAGNAKYLRAHEFTPVFWWGPCCPYFNFSVLSCVFVFVFVLCLVCVAYFHDCYTLY